MANVLFIGGPRDGQRLEVSDHLYRIEFLEYHPTDQPCFLTGPDTEPATLNTKKHVYCLMPFTGGKSKHYVYAFESLSGDDVLAKLIEGYKT